MTGTAQYAVISSSCLLPRCGLRRGGVRQKLSKIIRMKSLRCGVSLLLLAGGASLLFGGCVPRPQSESSAESTPSDKKQSTATPHPAKNATAEAVRRYPALGQKDSALNRKFVALFDEAKASDPNSLTNADWPLVLAARAAAALSAPSPAPIAAVSSRSFSSADLRSIEQAGTEIYGRVVGSNPDGCYLRVSGFSGGAWIARGAASAGVAVSPIVIFLEGPSAHGDGEQFQDIKIYPTGQFAQRGASKVRLYTSSASAALQHIHDAGEKAGEVVSADHSMWLHQQTGSDERSSGYGGSQGDYPVGGRSRLGL